MGGTVATVTTYRCSHSAPGARSMSRSPWTRPTLRTSSRCCRRAPPGLCTRSPSQSSSAPPSHRPRHQQWVTKVKSLDPALIGETLLAPAWFSLLSLWSRTGAKTLLREWVIPRRLERSNPLSAVNVCHVELWVSRADKDMWSRDHMFLEMLAQSVSASVEAWWCYNPLTCFTIDIPGISQHFMMT